MKMEVLIAPAEFEALKGRDLGRTACVVFDVLRATSSMVTALANGARRVVPVEDIPEAIRLWQADPSVLLAGERNGLRIMADQTGGPDFDLGNSPREFTPDRVQGRTIVMTTTNGTRALRACSGARLVLAAAFLNLRATAERVRQSGIEDLLVVCGGTFEQAALEDTLAAGGLCERLWPEDLAQVADSAGMARDLYLQAKGDLPAAVARARNGRRLLAQAALRDDVAVCSRLDVFSGVVAMDRDGSLCQV